MRILIAGIAGVALVILLSTRGPVSRAGAAYVYGKAVEVGEVSDLGNMICPVSGRPASELHTVIHNQCRHNLCSASCAKKFINDPQKYSAIAQQSLDGMLQEPQEQQSEGKEPPLIEQYE